MADALNRLPNQIELVGVSDQTSDAHMFILQPKWLQSVYEYLLKGVMPERFTTSQRQYLAKKAKPFVFQKGILYIFGQDNKFRQVLQPKHVSTCLQKLHGFIIGGHFFSNIVVRKILDVCYRWMMN
jgi:hypothetical protein